MSSQIGQEKLKVIYRLLFEMATGKQPMSISGNQKGDDYDILIFTLQELAHQLQALVLELGVVPPYYPYQNISQLLFVLSSDFRLQNFNREVVTLMKYSPETLVHISFENLIASSSIAVWKMLQENVLKDVHFFTTSELLFLTHDQHLLPLFCTVSRLYDDDLILVSSISTIPEDTLLFTVKHFDTQSKLRNDVANLQKLHAYILEHLDRPLPSLKELAKIFASEEHKLKTGFRTYYNSSIYQFYHHERLKKAQLLIQQTALSLKEIAFRSGFTTYVNFYKAFKKRYGYAPSDLSRPHQDLK